MMMFAIASAYAVGSVGAGAAADSELGYQCLPWLVAGVSALGGFIGWLAFGKSGSPSDVGAESS
jgi:hypothetical protein